MRVQSVPFLVHAKTPALEVPYTDVSFTVNAEPVPPARLQ
jgi:hypothetical protein